MLRFLAWLAAFSWWMYAPSALTAQSRPELPEQELLLDNYGDALPKGALLRLGTVRLVHGARIVGVFVTPDGKKVTAVDDDGNVRLWEVATGREITHVRLETGRKMSEFVALSPDGRIIAGAAGSRLRLWDTATGKHHVSVKEKLGPWRALAFSRDGKILSTLSATGELIRWDVASGKKVKATQLESAELLCSDFSPDATLVAGAGGNSIVLCDTGNGRLVRRLRGPSEQVCRIRFSCHGKRLAAGSRDRRIWVWCVASGKLLQQFKGGSAYQFAFFPDGRFLFMSEDEEDFQICDFSSGKRLGRRFEQSGLLFGEEGPVVSPDGKIMAASGSIGFLGSSRLFLWDTASGKLLGKGYEAPVPSWTGTGARYAPDGHSIFLANSRFPAREAEAERYALANGKRIGTFPGLVQDVAANGKTLATQHDGKLKLYDLASGELLWKGEVGHGWSPMAFSADGTKMVLEGLDQKLRIADARTGQLAREFEPLPFQYDKQAYLFRVRDASLAFSGNFKYVALVKKNDRTIEVREWKTGKIARRLESPITEPSLLKFSPDAEFLLAMEKAADRLILWHVRTGAKWKDEIGDQAGFSSAGKLLWVQTGEAATCWDLRGRRTLSNLSPVADWPLVFSPDGKMAATVGDKGVNVWEVISGALVRKFPKTRSRMLDLQLAPDNRTLLTLTESSVLVWDLTGHRLRARSHPIKLTPGEFGIFWKNLAGHDASAAHEAVWRLAGGADDAVSLLEKVLSPLSAPPEQLVQKLVSDLDSTSFNTRESATKTLLRMEAALPVLHKLLANNASLELRQRLQKLVVQLEDVTRSPSRIQAYRAIQALEYLGTARAQALLRCLADGAPGVVVTREADASLKRLAVLAR